MVLQTSRITFWVVALCLLCFATLSGAHTPRHPHARHTKLHRRSVISKAPEWTKKITFSPAHQDPAKAPPDPTDLELSRDSATSLNQYYKNAANATEASAGITPKSGDSRRSLEKRGSGPTYCKDGPCADDSCCGPEGICGYGPDFCGKGCTSNCDATAMCGEYSEDGDMPCGMNLCCSASGWCGTTEVFCDNADPLHKTLPCQAGYGSCNIASSPSCAKGGGSTGGRTIGYYQSWNVRTRKCDTKTPKQLDITGFTHLFYSFAFIDPTSFRITPAHNDDIKQMHEFTALSKDNPKLKTWIAIGGFDMSNEKTPTHTAWSDMVSTKANRAAFIASVRDYMDEYGFTGVDLDWEYPGEPKRGGRKLADTRNFSMLLREMRAAYGTNYGISLTLAPDYWYLRWFDAKAMEPYVDFFGFMAYDLHGFWDEDVKTLGKLVRGQADIQEISANTIPLWFAGLDPKKINFGLALYGRGYTLADKSCSSLLCSFVGPSKKGKCTDSDGVMSLQEIKNLIKEKNLEPTYLQDSMMKQITWDDQWIGYDDEETFAAKKAFADGLCFGGTMIWSIDFQAGGSSGSDDGGDVVYLDPKVYDGTPAQCKAPCRFVLPPRRLPSPTTISISPYVTSLQLAPGSTTTITVNVPVIKTESMEYYNVNITSGQTNQLTFTPTASLSIRPVTTTLTLSGGETQVRTLILPPWPSITNGPPDRWPTPTNPEDDPEDEEDLPPPSVAPLPIPDDEDVVAAWPEDSEDSDPAFVWPEIDIKPVPTPVSNEGEKPEGDKKQKTTCKLWFFWVCINWGDLNINIQGWEWDLPVGVWGPGPPNINLLKLPPGFTISGVLPPWPKMTVLPGGGIKTPEKPADCSPAEASLCLTTSSFATTVSAGQTKTTATSVVSRCATITGCNFRDAEATKSVDVCTLKRRNAEATDLPQVTGTAEEPALLARANDPDWDCAETDGSDYYVFMRQPSDTSHRTQIKDFLTNRETALKKRNMDGKWFEIHSQALDYTGFYYVQNLGPVGKNYLRTQMGALVYVYSMKMDKQSPKTAKRHVNDDTRDAMDMVPPETNASNETDVEMPQRLDKRAIVEEVGKNWHLSQISFPASSKFDEPVGNHNPNGGDYAYNFDDSLGQGQTFYLMEGGYLPSPGEYKDQVLDPLKPGAWGSQVPDARPFKADMHGYFVASYGVGKSVGVARNAKLVWVPLMLSGSTTPRGKLIEALLLITDDAKKKPKNSVVVNMSFGGPLVLQMGQFDIFDRRTIRVMEMMEEQLGVVFVAAGGNVAGDVNSMPAYAARHLKGMLAIGASTQDGVRATFSAWVKTDVDWFVYAPGDLLPSPPDGIATGDIEKGTSFASPLVAGLVAYLRASPSYQGGTSPADIRQAVSQTFSRKVTYTKNPGANRRRIIWNGQSGSKVCANGKSGPVARQLNSCPYDGSSSGGSGGNNGGSAPRGPPVTYIPGPNGPLCRENCGTLCSGFYCDPRPTGTVPDFTPPASIPSNGDPNEDPNHLPGLPDLPDPAVTNGIPVGKVCIKETTAIECNGGPRGGVCQTKTTCISTGVDPNFPVITPWQPPSSPAGATCASSTTWTLLGGPKGQATVTSSACASWKAKETPKPDPPKPKRRCITGHTYMRNCVGSPDTMYVQVWDNGILICDSGNGVWWASDKSVYRMDCVGGAKVEVTDNGSQITYTAADGFFVSGKNYDKQFDTQVCGTRPGRGDMPDVDIEGWLFENTFKTSDCDGWCPIPRLCDFDHSSCPFDGRCSS